MRRIAWGIFTLICTAALLASVGVWVRSPETLMERSDALRPDGRASHYCLIHASGGIGILRYSRTILQPHPVSAAVMEDTADRSWQLGNFRLNRSEKVGGSRTLIIDQASFLPVSSRVDVVFPLWFPTSLAALGATIGGWRVWRNAIPCGPTQCKSCGYDLRAGHEKCPECGSVSHVSDALGI